MLLCLSLQQVCMLCTASTNKLNIFIQLSVTKKHILMEKLLACCDVLSGPFPLLVWKVTLRKSPALAQYKLCFVLQDVLRFSMWIFCTFEISKKIFASLCTNWTDVLRRLTLYRHKKSQTCHAIVFQCYYVWAYGRCLMLCTTSALSVCILS